MRTARAEPGTAAGVRRLQRSPRAFSIDLRELWAYRELLYFFVWRDVKVRYKQTSLGIAWAVLQPLIAMAIFALIFGRLAGIRGEPGVPYPLFVYAGLLPWQYFVASLTQSSMSVVSGSALVTKVYFPRLFLPLASILVPLIDFACAFVVLFGMFAWYGRSPSWHLAALPVLLCLTLLTSLGIGLCLSALTVRYRDVPYAMPYLVQIWLYVTPVIYPVSLVPQHLQWLLALNPMTGVVEGFRWAVIGGIEPSAVVLGVSTGIGIALIALGLRYFEVVERRFADII